MSIVVRPLQPQDTPAAAQVHAQAFARQQRSAQWMSALARAYPRTLCFVLAHAGSVAGYIAWTHKSGFRPEAVLELEQLAVLPAQQGRGFGRMLIERSLPEVRARLAAEGVRLKHILVTTRADNRAQRLYAAVLGARVEATIADLYSADEVIMVARNVAPA